MAIQKIYKTGQEDQMQTFSFGQRVKIQDEGRVGIGKVLIEDMTAAPHNQEGSLPPDSNSAKYLVEVYSFDGEPCDDTPHRWYPRQNLAVLEG